ncbi:CDGSH iron-sulfur domain-containing protein [Streptomyces sp. enrichment culture]|uniref:CDGSH iron-sulfur domain-containing protein n=1 Tax=Streptomyces sp. enrichment culture TaxID=1795815 RepID=UPI003F54C586
MPSAPDEERPRTPAEREPAAGPCRVTVTREGPLLLDGPVEVTLDDGTVVRSDRFTVALCTCRRSRAYPWCDTSHRRRTKR